MFVICVFDETEGGSQLIYRDYVKALPSKGDTIVINGKMYDVNKLTWYIDNESKLGQKVYLMVKRSEQ